MTPKHGGARYDGYCNSLLLPIRLLVLLLLLLLLRKKYVSFTFNAAHSTHKNEIEKKIATADSVGDERRFKLDLIHTQCIFVT